MGFLSDFWLSLVIYKLNRMSHVLYSIYNFFKSYFNAVFDQIEFYGRNYNQIIIQVVVLCDYYQVIHYIHLLCNLQEIFLKIRVWSNRTKSYTILSLFS